MELKPGYEQTEVGVLPEDWRVVSIEDVAIVGRGRVISHRDIARAHNPQFPIYSSQTSNDGVMGYIDTFEFEGEYITWTTDGANAGTVFARNGRFNCTNVCGTIKLTSDSHSFVARVLAGFAPYHVSRHLGNPKLMNDIMKRVKIPLPSMRQEQDAIATALNDVDALLGGLDRLIAKKRALKQAAMQQLLTGQTRLPGFHGDWEMKTLFDLAERKKELFDDGDWIESEHITSEGVRLIQTGNIGVGCFIEKETKKYIYAKSFTSLQCKQLKAGDLLVCRLAAPAGRACVLPDIGEDRVITSVDVTIFRPPIRTVDRVFLANVFSSSEWFRSVSDRSGGTTHKRISRGALGRIAIRIPHISEQAAIATVLSDMDAELAALEIRRDKTRNLKQSMMQELLTGKTRLVTPEVPHA